MATKKSKKKHAATNGDMVTIDRTRMAALLSESLQEAFIRTTRQMSKLFVTFFFQEFNRLIDEQDEREVAAKKPARKAA